MALTASQEDMATLSEVSLTQEERLRLSEEIHTVLRDNVLVRLERLERAMDKADRILYDLHTRLLVLEERAYGGRNDKQRERKDAS